MPRGKSARIIGDVREFNFYCERVFPETENIIAVYLARTPGHRVYARDNFRAHSRALQVVESPVAIFDDVVKYRNNPLRRTPSEPRRDALRVFEVRLARKLSNLSGVSDLG